MLFNWIECNNYSITIGPQKRKILAVNYLNKSIVVDEFGNILHPNANIFSSEFEQTLENLLLKKHLIK